MFNDSIKRKMIRRGIGVEKLQFWMYSTPAVGSKKGRTRIGQSYQREFVTLQWTRTTRQRRSPCTPTRQFGISKFRRRVATEFLLGGFANLPTAGLPSQQPPSPMYSNHVSRNCVVNKKWSTKCLSREIRCSILLSYSARFVFDNLSDKQAAPVGLEPTTTGWEPCTPLRQSIMFRLLIRGAACWEVRILLGKSFGSSSYEVWHPGSIDWNR